MNSYTLYRVSFYVMMTIATTALCLDTSETAFGDYYPAIVAGCGVLAFFMIDQNPNWEVPRWVVNVLGLSTLILPYIEYNMDENQMIRAIGHWLVLLQLVMYLLPKSAREDWFLFGLGLLEVLIGSMINETDQVGLWLFLWALSAVWVLNLFFLQREARRFLAFPDQDEAVEDSPGTAWSTPSKLGPMPIDPYRGLVDLSFLFAAFRVMLAALALGGLIFLAMPRQAGAARNRSGPSQTRHLTGFGEEVQLGQLGEILEDDSVVMSIEFFDSSEIRTQPRSEPLWRGSTMAQYKNGRWHRQRQQPASLPVRGKQNRSGQNELSQQIRLEANDSQTLFGLRPIVEISSGTRLAPYINMIDGTISRPEARSGSYDSYDYRVISSLDPQVPQKSEDPPGMARLELLLDIPDDLKAKFRAIAEPIVADVKEQGAAGIEAKARKLEAYLRDSGEFGYTLKMDVMNPALDPVEDFLVNRKEGHCEYFASALALLLRSIEIPSRVINGFKGGDWNDVTQAMYVRRKHAHSWVEAYLGSGNESGSAHWVTLDPTPGLAREKSVSEVGGFTSNFRTLSDTIRHVWVFYILGFDAARQNRLVYEPIRELAAEVKRIGTLVYEAVSTYFGQLFRFEDLDSLISIRGFFVSFFLLTTLVLGVRGFIWLARRLLRLFQDPEARSVGNVAGILFYRRLAQLLGKYELEREPEETHREFARRAALFLGSRGHESEAVASVPNLVVDAFYNVRFGHLDLPPETLKQLEDRLDALEESLAQE